MTNDGDSHPNNDDKFIPVKKGKKIKIKTTLEADIRSFQVQKDIITNKYGLHARVPDTIDSQNIKKYNSFVSQLCE